VKTGWKRGFRVAVIASAAVLVAGGAVAVAQAAHGGKAKKHAVKQVVRMGAHADVSLIRADGTTDAFAVDRGKVTVSSATSLTLQRLDGKTVTVALNAGTLARGMVAVGRPVLVFSRNGIAFRVAAPGPRSAMPALAPTQAKSKVVHLQVSFIRADGTTGSAALDRGQVTATSSTSLTIKRDDGKSVTFAIGTSVKVRGKLAVGGKALVFSRDGAVVRVLAGAGPTAAR
jgi:hypothetical protein